MEEVFIENLAGPALGWAIATLAGHTLYKDGHLNGENYRGWWVSRAAIPNVWVPVSREEFQPGNMTHLLDDHKVSICWREAIGEWWACVDDPFVEDTLGWHGATRLEAGFRAMIVAKLGNRETGMVKVPDDLV